MTPPKLISTGIALGSDSSNCRRSLSRVFLLSPANTSAIRGQLLLNSNSEFELAQRIWRQGAPLGELFSFISSLYSRGKLAYAKAFSPSTGFPSTLVVTTSRGLLSPETVSRWTTCWKCPQFQSIQATLDIGSPFARMRALAGVLPTGSQIVLPGSIASGKYVNPLLEIFGANLLFPQDFVGRGDMSRGGLMLRCAQTGLELNYVSVRSTARRGSRPPKLSPNRRRARNGWPRPKK